MDEKKHDHEASEGSRDIELVITIEGEWQFTSFTPVRMGLDCILMGCGLDVMHPADLYLRFALRPLKQSGASYFAQAYIPTQPAQAIEGARISHAHEDPGRQEGNFPPARQGAQAGLGKTRFPRIVQWRGERSRVPSSMASLDCSGDFATVPRELAATIWKLRVSVTASVPGKSKREVEPGSGCGGFPRSARLLRHADFERVYKQGRRHFSASMTVFYWPRPETDDVGANRRPGLRIGFTVGRALGGAVQRNRMKRRLREAVRLTRPVAETNADVVINPKKTLLTVDFVEVVNEVRRAFVVIEQKLAGKAEQKA